MHPSLRILVAEDSVVIQTVLREMLARWGFEVVVTGDGAAAWEVLRSPGAPRLAIVDWMMPRMKGPELCRRLRSEIAERYTYVLMLTSRTDAADIIEGFDAGADDYLSKPFHARELWARIRTGMRIVQTRQELAEAREALRKHAGGDASGLPQGACILDVLRAAQDRTCRDGQPLSVLLVEIDRFHQIKESFGRMAGDLVLRECTERIRATKPASAVSGRYSGEEFLVVLPGMDGPAAFQAAERIRAAIGSAVFCAGAASFPVTCSVGVASREPGSSADDANLLRAADDALLAARAEGRERIADALRASAASVMA